MARILLVDDEEYIRLYYTKELSEEGHRVFTASTGQSLYPAVIGNWST